MIMDKIVIYDTETTNSTIWGSIIEVGAVVVDKNLKAHVKISGYLNWEDPQVMNIINQIPN